MRVGISLGDLKGHISYNPTGKSLSIDFPDEDVIEDIEEHLTTPRVFRIPESQELDDFREETARGIDSTTHMNLALSTLWANTDVWVNWE